MFRVVLAPLMVGFLVALLLSSCSPHGDYPVTLFTGDYRYTPQGERQGIAEFFNCADHKRYFVDHTGIYQTVQENFIALGLPPKEDAYLKVKGYLKQQTVIEGIDPVTVFVAVEFVGFNKDRGCELAH